MNTTKKHLHNTMNLKSYPDSVNLVHQAVVQVARKHNFEVYLVGGMVRQGIMRQGITDDNANNTNIDIDDNATIDLDYVPFSTKNTSDTDYLQFAELVSRKLRTKGVHFKDNTRLNITPHKQNTLFPTSTSCTIDSTIDSTIDITIDISKPRGAAIEHDLGERDFTINNLAMDMNNTVIGNPEDILHKTIRVVSTSSLTDDPLRVLRAYRFQSTLGYSIHPHTSTLMGESQHLLKGIPAERILKEVRNIFASSNREAMVQTLYAMDKNGILPLIFEGTSIRLETLNTIENNNHNNNDSWWNNLQNSPHAFEILFSTTIRLPKNNPITTLRNASMANNEQKLIRTLYQLCANTQNPLTTEQVWVNYNLLENIKWVYKLQNNRTNMAKLDEILATLNRQKGLTLTGNTLIQHGFQPSKQFKTILLNGQITMATTTYTMDETIEHLKKEYPMELKKN